MKIKVDQSRSFPERERTMDFHSLLEGVISDPGIDILNTNSQQGEVGLFFSHFIFFQVPHLTHPPKVELPIYR